MRKLNVTDRRTEGSEGGKVDREELLRVGERGIRGREQ